MSTQGSTFSQKNIFSYTFSEIECECYRKRCEGFNNELDVAHCVTWKNPLIKKIVYRRIYQEHI